MSEVTEPIPLHPNIIVVGGLPRTGKTTVGMEVARLLNTNAVDTDTLRAVFDGFPTLPIGYESGADIESCTSELRKGLEPLIARCAVSEGACLVLCGEAIDPRMIAESPHRNRITACFLGLNDPAAAFDRIRYFSNPGDWTAKLDDDGLRALLAKFARRSDRLQEQCMSLGIPYFDTSSGVPDTNHEIYELLVPQHLGQAALRLVAEA